MFQQKGQFYTSNVVKFLPKAGQKLLKTDS